MNSIFYEGVNYDLINDPVYKNTKSWYFTNKWGKYVEVINLNLIAILNRLHSEKDN